MSGQTLEELKAIYVPRDTSLKRIYIPPDVPLMHGVRSYWDRERNRAPVDHLERQDEQWYEEGDIAQIEEGMLEPNDEADSDDDETENMADVEFFKDGVKVIFNQTGKFSFSKDEFVHGGTNLTMKSFCRYLLALKTNISVGDVAFCVIASSIISFIPSPNLFEVCFEDKTPTRYKISSVINYFADLSNHLSTYKFNVCDTGSCIVKKDQTSRCIHPLLKKVIFIIFQ